jgi:hypothetical protein
VVFLAHEKGDMGRGMGIIERIGEVFEVRIEEFGWTSIRIR